LPETPRRRSFGRRQAAGRRHRHGGVDFVELETAPPKAGTTKRPSPSLTRWFALF
jgi:hypothetical protein